MQIFKEQPRNKDIGIIKINPSGLSISQGQPADVSFPNGAIDKLGCLKCANPRCLYFDDTEVECSVTQDFPNDQSKEVCPVGALKWNIIDNTPIIDSTRCIYCGVCAKRCPVGAIYYDDGTSQMKINTVPSQYQYFTPIDENMAKQHEAQIQDLISLPKIGTSINATDKIFDLIYEKLSRLNNQYHNIVVRNILIALGCSCAIRRIGDVYTRMDAVYLSNDRCFGAVEIEYGRDTLDASRGILDDIAVLFTRYSIPIEANNPLVVCLSLPNARQGYWQVVRDVRIVKGIRIQTLSIGALLILLWNGAAFQPSNNDYYIDFDNMELRGTINKQLGTGRINLSNGYLGILEPLK